MVNSAAFGKRLEKILDYYGLSATAFSEELSFNRSTISHLISGRNKPSLEFVLKVLERFPEVELYWLLHGKGTFPIQENEDQVSHPKISALPKNEIKEEAAANNKELENVSPLDASATQFPSTFTNSSSSIERIIIFYKNGSFREYKNE